MNRFSLLENNDDVAATTANSKNHIKMGYKNEIKTEANQVYYMILWARSGDTNALNSSFSILKWWQKPDRQPNERNNKQKPIVKCLNIIFALNKQENIIRFLMRMNDAAHSRMPLKCTWIINARKTVHNLWNFGGISHGIGRLCIKKNHRW